MVMYDDDMIMSLKQKKRKFKPRIKLNHNTYTDRDVLREGTKPLGTCLLVGFFSQSGQWIGTLRVRVVFDSPVQLLILNCVTQ